MITWDNYQHDEEHRRLSGGGSVVVPFDSIRLVSSGAVNGGTPVTVNVAGVSGIPGEIKAVWVFLFGASATAGAQLLANNPDSTSGNSSARLYINAANNFDAKHLLVPVSKAGTIVLSAVAGNFTNVFLDVIGYVLQH